MVLWICRSEIGGMEVGSKREPCRVAVIVGAMPSGLRMGEDARNSV
jgi:hypothetical protein